MAAGTLNGPGGNVKSRLRRAAVVLLGTLCIVAVSACESTKADRAEVIDLVNQSRQANGLGPVSENYVLDVKADGWARHLRDICNLEHSKLSDGAPPEWQKLGENVGYGGNIDQVMRSRPALLGSGSPKVGGCAWPTSNS